MDLQRKTFSQTFETGGSTSLLIDNRSGAIRVRGGDAGSVRVDADLEVYADSPEAAESEVARIMKAVQFRDGGVEIRTPELLRPSVLFGEGLFGRGPHVDYDISVPRDTRVTIEAHNGRIEVRAVAGPVAVDSHNGAISVAECGQAVTIESHNGKVDVSDCPGSVKAGSHNGRISIERVAGEVEVVGHNGPQSLVDLGGPVRARTDNGHIEFQGAVKTDLTLQATNGSLRLRLPSSSRFEIDAEAERGTVRSDFSIRDQGGNQSAPRPKISLRTVHGSILIESV